MSYQTYGTVKPIKLPATDNLPERTCYDLYGGASERQSTANKDFLLKDALLNNNQFLAWVQIAYQIFASKKETCWNHSNLSWENNFGAKANYMDLIDCLCNRYDKTGKKDSDSYMSTGLVLTNNLSDVEMAAGKLIERLIHRKLKAKDFVEHSKLEPFHDNTDKQTVYYTIAAHVDRYGGTFQYCYNAFGLAFYNFRLKVVADGKPYNTAIGNRTIEEAIKEENIPGFIYQNTGSGETVDYPAENKSAETISQTVTCTSEVTETESNSITNSEEYSFSEMIGMSIEIADVLDVCTTTMEMQFTAGEVIGTAYSEEKSVSKTENKSSSLTAILPPHTALVVRQKNDDTITELEYDCPVMIQFDVAVFSMCGTCYDDNAAVHTFKTAGYDQRSFISIFQPSETGNAGEEGSENLYMRCTKSASINGYDKAHGLTQLKTYKEGLIADQLDWNTILKQPKASTNCKWESQKVETQKPQELVDWLVRNRPMSPTGATLTEKSRSIVSVVENPIPLYALGTIRQISGYSCYDVGVGDDLYPETWEVEGYDILNVPFYGFEKSLGSWTLVDEQGEDLTDDSIAGIYKESLTNRVYIRGNAEGTVYAKYMIPNNYYTCQTGKIITNNSITQTAFVKIIIHDSRLEGKITTNGSISVNNQSITNLERYNGVNVHVYDETGCEIFVPLVWETEPGTGNGVKIVDNIMAANEIGTYRIRARYENLLSDSLEVYVTE